MNRFYRFTAIVLFLSLPLAAVAQDFAPFRYDTEKEIKEDIMKAGGEVYVSDFEGDKSVSVPRGYEPFYISTFGRHGARYVHDAGTYTKFKNLLDSAFVAGILTEKGLDLMKRYEAFYPLVSYREGELTFLGQEQWRKIARQMFASYPQVFEGNTHSEVYSTVVERVLMSMFSFVDELKTLDSDFSFKMDASVKYLTFLQPNKYLSPNYIADKPYSDSTISVLNEFRSKRVNPQDFTLRFFKDTALVVKYFDNLWDFESRLMNLVMDIQCLDGVENPFEGIFTADELFRIWEVRNFEGYLWAGASPLTDNKARLASYSCLEEIISSATEDMKEGNVRLRLRFSHDSGLLPLLSFMRLNNFGAVINNPDEVKDYWRSFEIPMASNLQLVFYRNSGGHILVRPLYNGKSAVLPFKEKIPGFYDWEEFKSYYQAEISEAKTKLCK